MHLSPFTVSRLPAPRTDLIGEAGASNDSENATREVGVYNTDTAELRRVLKDECGSLRERGTEKCYILEDGRR